MNGKITERGLTIDIYSILRLLILTIILGLIYSTALFSQNTYYIDPTYGSGGNGSINQPYDSWTDVSPLQANTTYLQKRGTTTTSRPTVSSGTPNVTMATYGSGGYAKIIDNRTSNGAKTIDIGVPNNFYIRGYELQGNYVIGDNDRGGNRRGIQMTSSLALPNTSKLTVDSCSIHTYTWGVHSWASSTNNGIDSVIMTNSKVYDVWDDGVFLQQCMNGYFKYDSMWDINMGWVEHTNAGGDNIQLSEIYESFYVGYCYLDHSGTPGKQTLITEGSSQSYPQGNFLFEYNEIGTPQIEGNEQGIYVNFTTDVGIIRYNKIWGDCRFLWSAGVDNIIVYGNEIQSFETPIVIAGGYAKPVNFECYNNTFYMADDNQTVWSVDATDGFISNNIFDSYGSWSGQMEGVSISHNLFHNCATKGTNAISGNPDFINPGIDFHLQSTSPAIDAGTNVGLTEDMDGTSLPQGSGYDIGCYEFISGGGGNPPNANFTANTTTPTVSQTVNFTDQSTNNPTSWAWSFNPSTITYMQGTNSSSQNPKVSFDQEGSYTVTLTATNNNGSDTEIKNNYITASGMAVPPVAEFTADNTTPTTLQIVSFTDQSANGPTTWSWSFNPTTITFMQGTNSSSQNPNVRFDQDGSYSVTLTATNSAGSDTEVKNDYITVTSTTFPPLANFEADNTTPTIAEPVHFTDLSSNNPTSWSWSSTPETVTFLEGTNANSQNPVVRFDDAGSYTIILTATNSAGADTEIKTNYITATVPTSAPIADFEADNTTPVIDEVVHFTDLSLNNPTSWNWSSEPGTVTFYEGTNTASQNPVVSFDAPGSYTVTLTATNSAGSNTETKIDYIIVSTAVIPPVADFVADNTTPNTEETVSFTDLSTNNPNSWNWSFDPSTITFMEGTNDNSQNPKVRFDEAGNYTATLLASNSAGSDSEVKNDYITASVVVIPPVADFSADITTPNTDQTVNFSDNSTNGPSSWNWTFDPSTITFMEGTSESSQNPRVKFNEEGSYTVTLIATNSAGSDSETKNDYINATVVVLPPVADFSADNTTPTVGQTVHFTDLSTNNPTSWTWSSVPWTVTFLEGTNANSQNPVVQFDEPGSYSVTLTATNSAGSDDEAKNDYVIVTTVVVPPVADFSTDNILPNVEQTVSFNDLSTYNPDSWSWSFNPSTITFMEGTNGSSQNPKVRFDEVTSYTVTLTATNSAGSDSETKNDYINVIVPSGNSMVYIDPTNSGDPAQDGTMDHPYDSWDDILWSDTSYMNGKTFMQKRGTTFETNQIFVLSNANGVSFGSYGDGVKPILFANNPGNHIINIRWSENCIVQDLHLKGETNTSGIAESTSGINFLGYPDLNPTLENGHIIENCEFSFAGSGIRMVNSNGITIENCIVHNIENDGIYASNVNNLEISGSSIYEVNLSWYHIGQSLTEAPGDGIQLIDCDNFNVHHNDIDRSNSGNNYCFNYNSSSTEHSGVFDRNTCISPNNEGELSSSVYLGNGTGHQVCYNKFQGESKGISSNSRDCDIFYNLFNHIPAGITSTNSATSTNVLNNIFYDVNQHVEGGNLVIKNNIFNLMDGNDVAINLTFPSILEEANNLYSLGVGGNNSIIGDPKFANPQTGDFHLQESSPCIDFGLELGYTVDMDSTNVPQGAGPDIGTFEFTGQQINTPPIINNQTYTIEENLQNGQFVGIVSAFDPDAGQELTYTIISGNNDNAFQLNSTSGEITIDNPEAIDFETNPYFSLMVEVEDNGIGNLTDQAEVTILLIDNNDPPVIMQQSFMVDVDGNLLYNEPNTVNIDVGNIVAYDPDAGQTISYEIVAGNERDIWEIETNTGELSLVDPRQFNPLEVNIYPLDIKVSDNSMVQLYTTATINIYVNIYSIIEGQTKNIDNAEGEELSELSVNLYPNPALNQLSFDIENLDDDKVSFSIVNSLGEIIMKRDFYSESNNLNETIDVNNLVEGLYFVHIENAKKVSITKLVKL